MRRTFLLCLLGLAVAFGPAVAQEDEEASSTEENQVEEGEDTEADADDTVSDTIVVTGSRIATSPLYQRAPLVEVGELEIKQSGLTNIGQTLQQIPSMGSAINARFNVPGNSGFPQDGNGIGAGAIQLSLRNVGAKRTLVLVDGKRWIPGASASGVSNSVDLNTLPANMIEKVEVLQDGASAIYGSDAIGGVVNIITRTGFQGMQIGAQTGRFVSEGDGEGTEVSGLWGTGNEDTHLMFSASYYQEGAVTTTDRAQSAFPNPFATSCDVPGTLCSSFTPQGRFILGPNFDFASITLNDGVLNDGVANIPVFNPDDPGSGDFHTFTSADRFNYNGFDFNYLKTPNQRVNLHTSLSHALSEATTLNLKASYTNRQSSTRAAPEPLCLGNGCGNRIAENILIHRDNPFNPFGIDLSVANGNLEFFGRRPLESGPRIFEQDVDTYFTSASIDGEFTSGSRNFSWDITASYGENSGFQQKFNSHNIAKIALALGDPAICALVPNCVPFNFFGGQGPNGTGSITQEMLDFITYTQRDFSDQEMTTLNADITGDLFELSNQARVGFAAGVEYRDQKGSFQPDPIAASGETAGIPSAPTAGGFDVTEAYLELNFPLLIDSPMAEYLELNVATRYSDYSTFGGEDTYKLGVLYRPTAELSLRGSISTGIRAPGIGELFGGAAREDFTFLDPCADVLGVIGSANGGRDTPQPANIVANCAALGVPTSFAQRNPQLSAISAGNERLVPETSDGYSFGFVYSPTRTSQAGWSLSVDFYDLQIDNAIQGRDPGEVIDACVATLDPFFCDAVERASSGLINLVDNQLQNIGGIEASGADLAFGWTSGGAWGASLSATYLDNYTELTRNPDGSLTSTDRTGTITNETFQRAFAEWRARARVDRTKDNWYAGLTFRWEDSMIQDSGSVLASILYTDLLVRWDLPGYESSTLAFGINNLLDEDPSVCDSCGVVSMSPFHDLPGMVGYVRLEVDLDASR